MTKTVHRRLYVDMDGTLCRFHDADHRYIENMWTQGFYKGLKPFATLVEGLRLFIQKNPDIDVYVLSAVLDTEPPFVEGEKREWLHTYLPEISDDNMIFVPAGADKSAYVGATSENDVLLDDYNKNLREWQKAGGTAVKFVNDVNNRGLGAYGGEKGELWEGQKIAYRGFAFAIASQLENAFAAPPYSGKQQHTDTPSHSR